MRRPLRDWSAPLAAFVAGAALVSVITADAQDRPPADNPIVQARALAAEQVDFGERILAEIDKGRDGLASLRVRFEAARDWSLRLVEARLSLARSTDERADALQPHIDRLERQLEWIEDGIEQHVATALDRDKIRFELLEARRRQIFERGL